MNVNLGLSADEVRHAKYAQAFDLYVTQGMSYVQIAKMLCIKPKTLEQVGARQHWTRHRVRYQEAEAGASGDEITAAAAARQAKMQLELIQRAGQRIAVFEKVISAKLQRALAEREEVVLRGANDEEIRVTVPTLPVKDLDALLKLNGDLLEQSTLLGKINAAEVEDRMRRINQFQATLSARRRRAFGEIIHTRLPPVGTMRVTPAAAPDAAEPDPPATPEGAPL